MVQTLLGFMMMARSMTAFWRMGTAVLVTVILAFAASLFLTTRTGSAGQPPPGLTAGVSALDTLPAQASVPEAVRDTLRAFDPAVVGPLDRASSSVRRLRNELGSARTAIYALRSQKNSVCVIVRDYSGICPSSLDSGHAGILISLGGGLGTESAPPILAGIASDIVTGIELTVDGSSIPVSIQNNALFAELPLSARDVTLRVHYRGFDDQVFRAPALRS